MLHHDADTCLLLNFITKPIKLLFSVRQGDPFSMILFIIYMEPLLLRISEVSSGITLNARLSRTADAPQVPSLVETDESFVDDVDIFCSSDDDFIQIDKCFERFEQVSGAILNRSSKSVVLGLGRWKDRQVWPLSWLQTVQEKKVFGFIIHWKYKEIINRNWTSQFQKFSRCIYSWSDRILNSLQQRVDVLTLFALSKVWYKAQVLPLPNKFALQFERLISKFLWKGQITSNVIAKDTVTLPKDRGGLVCQT